MVLPSALKMERVSSYPDMYVRRGAALYAQMNRRYLIGQAVDPDITEGIKKILMDRGSIEQLHQVKKLIMIEKKKKSLGARYVCIYIYIRHVVVISASS